ncbi:unnamed protein product, partial [Callosobruchus maculatus]
IKVKL